MSENISDIVNKLLELEKQKLSLIFELLPLYYVQKNDTDEQLLTDISSLGLEKRTINCLKYENLFFIGDIVCNKYLNKPSSCKKFRWLGPLLKTYNFGMKSMNDLTNKLADLGFTKHIHYSEYLSLRKQKTGEDYEYIRF